ncbi:MAG: aldo/keto reductase [Clostridia bacterium]|nr:aldo/keto reductase [Clostridia bacterium]
MATRKSPTSRRGVGAEGRCFLPPDRGRTAGRPVGPPARLGVGWTCPSGFGRPRPPPASGRSGQFLPGGEPVLSAEVERIRIPGLDREISRIGLGTWAMGGWMWGGSDEADAVASVERAFEMGINLVDTAPVYGFGRAEEIVGHALRRIGHRQELVIATKVGLEWNARGEIRRNSRPERIRQEVEESLRRLGVDVIDLYQVHWPDPSTPVESTAETLLRLREEGKIRAIGVSNYSVAQMERWRQAAPLHTAQPPYNLFEREAEREILPYCREHGVATLTYGVLARGLLTGKFTAGTTFPEGDLRRQDPKFQGERFRHYLEAVDRLRPLAERHGRSLAQLAARWALQQPGVQVSLWGVRRPAQVEEVAGVWGWSLDAGELAEIERILAESIPEPVGPEFMAPPEA